MRRGKGKLSRVNPWAFTVRDSPALSREPGPCPLTPASLVPGMLAALRSEAGGLSQHGRKQRDVGCWRVPRSAHDKGAEIRGTEQMPGRHRKHLLQPPPGGQDEAFYDPSLSSTLPHFLMPVPVFRSTISPHNACTR